MARKPNYQFERMERQRAKDAKKAARLDAKRQKAEESNADNDGVELADGETGDSQSNIGRSLRCRERQSRLSSSTQNKGKFHANRSRYGSHYRKTGHAR